MMKKLISVLLVMFMLFSALGLVVPEINGSGIAYADGTDSGIVESVANGVQTIHAYDNFNEGSLNTDVWESNSHFYVTSNKLYTQNYGSGA